MSRLEMGLTNAGFARFGYLPCTAEGAARTSCRVGNHCRVAWSCGKNERDKIDTSHALSITFFSLSFYTLSLLERLLCWRTTRRLANRTTDKQQPLYSLIPDRSDTRSSALTGNTSRCLSKSYLKKSTLHTCPRIINQWLLTRV